MAKDDGVLARFSAGPATAHLPDETGDTGFIYTIGNRIYMFAKHT
jgi:hypothetical protein